LAIALAGRAAELYSGIATFTYSNAEEVFAVGFSMIVLGAVAFVYRKERNKLRKLRRLWRGKKMTRKEYDLYARNLVGSKVSDLLTDLVVDGKLSDAKGRQLMRRINQVINMKDMLPVPLQAPMTEETLSVARHIHLMKKVKIPGPKPGEEVKTVDHSNVVQLPAPKTTKFGNLVRKRAQ